MTVRLPSSTHTNDESGRKTWVRAVYDALGGLVSGKQDGHANLTSIAGLTLTGNSGDAIVVKATEDGFELAAGGGGGTTTNALTITNAGGAAPGTTFDGSVARTIDYSTVGAAASGHDHNATYLQLSGGTLSGDMSVPDEAYDATAWNGSVEVPTKNAIRDKIESLTLPGSGTSFPGSPSAGNRFIRTDRNIEYVYDGTRWLSAQLFILNMSPETGSNNPITASPVTQRHGNPWAGLYDIYVETFQVTTVLTNGTTGSNYYTIQPQAGDGGSLSSLGSSTSTQSDTQNARTVHRTTINSVVASTVESLEVLLTETGAASLFSMATFTYRLVG